MKERKQFGAPLAAFQLTQQKLVCMLGNIQAMILVGWRLCKLYDSGKMTPGRVSLGKVWAFIVSCSCRFAMEVMHCIDDVFSRHGLPQKQGRLHLLGGSYLVAMES